jgi:hypothetical protein
VSVQANLHLAPLPAIAFRVGVTGHRPNRLDKAILPELASQLSEILQTVAEVTRGCPRLREEAVPPQLRLISSLAEGADSMAAEAALKLCYQLDVPLPFEERAYENTFLHHASVRTFQYLLNQAGRTFRLNSDPASAESGYRAAGEVTVSQSDMLIAIWDGNDPHGIGGTGEVVARALELGIPVMHIQSQDPSTLRWLDANGVDVDAMAKMRIYITGLLSLHEGDGVCKDKPRAAKHFITAAWQRMKRFAKPTSTALQAAQRYLKTQWPKRFDPTAYMLIRLIGERRIKRPVKPRQSRDIAEIETPALKRYFLWSDTLAVHYGERSRSAALRIQLWAALTIFSSLMSIPFEHHKGPWYFSPQVILACVEVFSTLAVLTEALIASHFQWHVRWLSFRAIAEQVRSLDLLHPIGLAIPRPHGFSAEDQPSGDEAFSAFLVQSIVRELGLPCSLIDEDFIRGRFARLHVAIKQQIAFHSAASERYEKVEKFLTHGSLWVFVVAALVCLYDLFHALGLWTDPFGIVLMCTVMLPVLGATFAALAAQGEYRRLAHRSDAMRRTLQGIANA